MGTFLGTLCGYLAGVLIHLGWVTVRNARANKRVDKHVKQLVDAIRTTPETPVVRVPIVARGPGDVGN